MKIGMVIECFDPRLGGAQGWWKCWVTPKSLLGAHNLNAALWTSIDAERIPSPGTAWTSSSP